MYNVFEELEILELQETSYILTRAHIPVHV
jgi:hypothetical protein